MLGVERPAAATRSRHPRLACTPWGYFSVRLGTVPGYHDHKADYLTRLRIEGQVRGLQRMVDEDVYCIDILTQASAAITRLLKS